MTDLQTLLHRLNDDRGNSMVEVLTSITLTAIAFAAIFSALSGVDIAARAHDQNMRTEAALTQAKQALEDATYNSGGYVPPAIPGATITYSAPTLVAGATALQSITVQVVVGSETRTTVVQKTAR